MDRLLPLLFLPLLAPLAAAAPQREAPAPAAPPPAPRLEMWVSGFNSNALHRFHPRNGSVLGPALPVAGPQSVTRGPDGFLYVTAEAADEVWRYEGTERVRAFIRDDPGTPADETGGLDGPTAAVFGPDGHLYVASFESDAILRYHGTTGEFLGPFVTPGQNGLDGPDSGTTFGPDGHLYVPSWFTNRILRFDGTTGAFLGVFVGQGSGQGSTGGLNQPRMLVFRPNGELWVSSSGSSRILAYDENGKFLREILRLGGVSGFAISPVDGDLYVTSSTSNLVRAYDGYTGELLRTVVPPNRNGLLGAVSVAFVLPTR